MKLWSKIKNAFKKKETEEVSEIDVDVLRAEILRLQSISLLKDEAYLIKHMEAENFRKSAFATLAAIALAHGGEYFVDNAFTATVTSEEFTGNLRIVAEDNGVRISVNEPAEPQTKGE